MQKFINTDHQNSHLLLQAIPANVRAKVCWQSKNGTRMEGIYIGKAPCPHTRNERIEFRNQERAAKARYKAEYKAALAALRKAYEQRQ